MDVQEFFMFGRKKKKKRMKFYQIRKEQDKEDKRIKEKIIKILNKSKDLL